MHVMTRIQEVRTRHEAELLRIPGVVSVGIGLGASGDPVIVVGVESDPEEASDAVPRVLDGFAVEVRCVDTPRAQ
jgi:hypothetical protein